MADRDEHGKFVVGNQVKSPGRPPVKVERHYLQALTEECTLDDWRKIVLTAISLAKAGDHKAREWISNYLIGKPVQILQLETGETALLAELLEAVENQGIDASMLFASMLAELSTDDVIMIESEIDHE